MGLSRVFTSEKTWLFHWNYAHGTDSPYGYRVRAGTVNDTASATKMFGGLKRTTTTANDGMAFKLLLFLPESKSLTASIIYETASTWGIAKLCVYDCTSGLVALYATLDQYTGSTVWDNEAVVSLGTLAAGVYEVCFLTTGTKNASSSGEAVTLQGLTIYETP